MFGIGLWANLNLASMTGLGTYDTSYGNVTPVLHFAAEIGDGEKMRFSMWEASLEVFSSMDIETDYATLPGLSFEIGYAYYRFDETVTRDETIPDHPGVAKHDVDIIILRATMNLPQISL